MAIKFKTFANSDSESKPAEVFDTQEKKEAYRKRMAEAIRQNKLYRAKAMQSAKKIWIGR